ncbi:PIN domain-containing protein [Bifidobacterium saguini DSM 23967]|uniref:Ribonuclease VapC n=3 Tax=Bifidobacterium saguini TaxID=762210 RepID=A0A087D8F4_9BIFI|nr:PIN domain-containing protein [Bifidobacterium saguini DSM 23967]QTB92035.1 type II toxin-antitoxin system VapC family toxin [Bifidobacterium saguini]
MIVLDTNVVSEIIARQHANHSVQNWIIAQNLRDLYTTSITGAELLYGVALMPTSHRKNYVQNATAAFLDNFRYRTFDFDVESAAHYAAITASRRQAGRPIGVQDAMIAAIARSHGAAVATRNIKDFEDTGVELINPWEYTK